MNELAAFFQFLNANAGDSLAQLLEEYEMNSDCFSKDQLENVSEDEINRLFRFLIFNAFEIAYLDRGDIFEYLTGPEVGMDVDRAIYLLESDEDD